MPSTILTQPAVSCPVAATGTGRLPAAGLGEPDSETGTRHSSRPGAERSTDIHIECSAAACLCSLSRRGRGGQQFYSGTLRCHSKFMARTTVARAEIRKVSYRMDSAVAPDRRSAAEERVDSSSVLLGSCAAASWLCISRCRAGVPAVPRWRGTRPPCGRRTARCARGAGQRWRSCCWGALTRRLCLWSLTWTATRISHGPQLRLAARAGPQFPLRIRCCLAVSAFALSVASQLASASAGPQLTLASPSWGGR